MVPPYNVCSWAAPILPSTDATTANSIAKWISSRLVVAVSVPTHLMLNVSRHLTFCPISLASKHVILNVSFKDQSWISTRPILICPVDHHHISTLHVHHGDRRAQHCDLLEILTMWSGNQFIYGILPEWVELSWYLCFRSLPRDLISHTHTHTHQALMHPCQNHITCHSQLSMS